MKISTVIHNSGDSVWRPVFWSGIPEEAIKFYRDFNEAGKVALVINPPIDRSKTIKPLETAFVSQDEPVLKRKK